MKDRNAVLTLLLGLTLALPLTRCGKSSPSNHQSPPGAAQPAFRYSTVATGLANPSGIAFGAGNTLLVSQQPQAPLDASMARIDLETGSMTLLAPGPGVQSGFAANSDGRLYWVDPVTGALMTQSLSGEPPAILHAGGALPATALAVDALDRVYVAGRAAAQGSSGTAAVLVMGDAPKAVSDTSGPEKTTLVAASSGDLYWTSASAGVIYHRSPDGQGNVLISGLKAPRGLALGPFEDVLYFTEVPTPGKDGASGGDNRVSAVDLATLGKTVIHQGDPEPAGVAVAADGRVFWTSARRGEVEEATPLPLPPEAAQFKAALSGGEEVPPVTTKASGQAFFTLVNGTRTDDDRVSTGPALRYRVDITGISNVRRLEIRQGAMGKTGPLVAVLSKGRTRHGEEGDRDVIGRTSFSAAGRIRLGSLQGPFANDWAGFSAALANDGLYLNVLTAANPGGEVRGQILPLSAPPANRPPAGTITAPTGSVTIQAGQSVAFSGTATDPDGDAVTVLWDFGDGSTSTLATPPDHVYPQAGSFTVTFTATDAFGLADPNPPTRAITVQGAGPNLPPAGAITSPATGVTITAGQSVNFAGTATDPNGDPVTVLWTFGDGGTSTLLAPGANVYAAAGTYMATLVATDSHGLADPNPPTRAITVSAVPVNQAPNGTITAPAANVTIAVGQSVTFAGTTTDPDNDAVTVLWAFGDGATSTSLSPGAHVYATAGTFTVTFTATDSHGLADPTPSTRTITVTAAAAPTLTQIQTTIFTASCVSCHDAGGSAGLNLTAGNAFSNLVNVPATTLPGLRVVPGDPANSALVIQLANGHRSVSAANQSLISAWITAGALNN